MRFDLLIFDLDGTLIDSKLDLALAVNATRANAGMEPIPHEAIYSYVGNGAPRLIRSSLGPSQPRVKPRKGSSISTSTTVTTCSITPTCIPVYGRDWIG